MSSWFWCSSAGQDRELLNQVQRVLNSGIAIEWLEGSLLFPSSSHWVSGMPTAQQKASTSIGVRCAEFSGQSCAVS